MRKQRLQTDIGKVAPLAGAWIEIDADDPFVQMTEVAPLAGAWIEIENTPAAYQSRESLPSRERGLKFTVTASCMRY